jgi:LuxR family transcriptional regulator, maltose regulon positive regulatory protein
LSDIQHVYPLIHNKVTSPHYVTPTLRRGRLLDWLHASATCRAVVIAADAGYGKTTLLWQWEREVGFPCYWYKLDRNDRDWSLHISYLIESIAQRHPGFGRRAHSMLEQLGGPGSSRPGVAAYLLAEMYERLTEPCTFIIDDWQFVSSVTEVRGLWNQILRDAPPTCRFVFLSRAKPQLQFARFKTHGGYAEMRTDALRFTDPEIEELFRDIYNDPLESVDIAELERRTEGWAASLQLVEVSLRERRSPEERRAFIQSIAADTETDLVEFLAQEVLDQQAPQLRAFLLSTSILQQIHPTLAASLAGVEDGDRLLKDLVNGGLFTYQVDASASTYRFHGLFREFLLKRLEAERSQGELAALHIHAASYFETHALWPEAIDHYMEAGLQPQAARLIAKYGEDLVSTGRLPLVEGWLATLPGKSVHDNARLSLLHGEICGVAGDWEHAFTDLRRARLFFARKADPRMEAVACSKLSTVYNDFGDTVESAKLAREGLALAPADSFATRIRLRGNLAVTATFFESFESAIQECKRVAIESSERGYEQFAAISHHNLGVLLRDAGRLDESLANLTRAARYWDASPSNPFADSSELVLTLLALGRDEDAASVADSAVTRTAPWERANSESRVGLAAVNAHQGRFAEAIDTLRELADRGDLLGSARERVLALLVECLYLSGGTVDEMRAIGQQMEGSTADPRLALNTAVGKALIAHRERRCGSVCETAYEVAQQWHRIGAHYAADRAELPLAVLAVDHDVDRGLRAVSTAARKLGSLNGHTRWWIRRIAKYVQRAVELPEGLSLLIVALQSDPSFWTPYAAQAISAVNGPARHDLLMAIQAHSGSEAIEALRGVDGVDVQEARRALIQRTAPRILVRSFGALAVHRDSWDGPMSPIGRKRIRLLLGLLVANFDAALTRDQVVDSLWPDADPASAVNSLNQAVFQLRRIIDPGYKEGESPQYVISNVDTVQLNPELVSTDLAAIRRLRQELMSPAASAPRVDSASALVSLIKGEFLSELKYEDWVSRAQMSIHSEVRSALLPIARGDMGIEPGEWAFRAGCALVSLDAYDEDAHVAMIRHLATTGRRSQARTLANGFAMRLKADLDEEPSEELLLVSRLAGGVAAV